MKKKKSLILLPIIAFLLLAPECATSAWAQQRKLSRIESKADRHFSRQKFNKAMSAYETAILKEQDDESRAALSLKVGRLYFMTRNYSKACEHYAYTMDTYPNLFNVEDICDYVDALRFSGNEQMAEAICLNNAYKDQYSRYQRYQNTLDALSMRYILREDPAYNIKKLAINTPNAEFWIGNFDDQPFYAVSFSPFNDPGKLFFHRTHYYALNMEGVAKVIEQKPTSYNNWFRRIPTDLQNGPVSFTPDMKMMVATNVEYAKSKATVEMADRKQRPFRTKLLYSVLKDGKRRYTRFAPVFAQEKTYSYAHPFLFNNGKSMFFTSDMPGGYGGFDIYVTHWDTINETWGAPENLGPLVNTEGDEIFPVLYNGLLIFSSNGLPGFGGYDLFYASYDLNGVVPGSIKHFPYPVNSLFNDYYMLPVDAQIAYFVSDRDPKTGDDIYFLETTTQLGTNAEKPFFGMSEDKAVLGGELLLNALPEVTTPEMVSLKQFAPEGLLLSVYFDFDSDQLTPEAQQSLNHLASGNEGYEFTHLRCEGFADEFGSDEYNMKLSDRRAHNVVAYLQSRGMNIPFDVQAYGKTKLSPGIVKEEVSLFRWPEGYIDWVQVNRRARRVDIYNKR